MFISNRGIELKMEGESLANKLPVYINWCSYRWDPAAPPQDFHWWLLSSQHLQLYFPFPNAVDTGVEFRQQYQ